MKQEIAELPRARGVIADMADRFNMDPRAFEATLRATVVPKDATAEQFAAFLLVAREYNLNPIIKQIYAFPSRSGGIQPIVSIDGWIHMIVNHPAFDGMEFVDQVDNTALVAITCRMYRKDRTHHTEVTEYMAECRRDTDTWKRWPVRMLRHKATIQCARYAFGFSGVMDQDEAERANEAAPAAPTLTDGVRRKAPAEQPEPVTETAAPAEMPADLNDLLLLQVSRAATAEDLDYIRSRGAELPKEQRAALNKAITDRFKAMQGATT